MKQTLMIRNVGISAHIDSGKTTLTERMLYYCGRIHQMREVRGGNGGAAMDHDPIERRRGITINSAVTYVNWQDHTINIVDTPGHVDFTVEVERSLRVLDGAVLVLCGVGGVQSQSLTVDQQMRRYGVPRIAFVNKLDRMGADPNRVVTQLRERLNANAVALQIPIGIEKDFRGLVDLVTMEAVFCQGTDGAIVVRERIPSRLMSAAKRARAEMLDALAATDDALLEMMINGDEPSPQEIRRVVREATIARTLTPVLMGSAFMKQGVKQVLDAITAYLPAPNDREVFANDHSNSELAEASSSEVRLNADSDDPLVALAFKTVVEPFGQLTFLRIYQGRIDQGGKCVNARTGQAIRFGRLVRIHADQHEEVASAEAGDVIGVIGVDCASGDTFVTRGTSISLENIVTPVPVMRMAIAPARRQDAGKLAKALERFRRDDPTFHVSVDSDTGETIIAGMGQLHLDVYVERLRESFDCDCVVGRPSVTYKERPTRSVEFDHTLKRQNGGQGMFARIIGRMDALAESSEASFVFDNRVSGGRLSRPSIKAARDGIVDALRSGPLAGWEVVGVKLTLLDGVEHEKDSSELAFRTCASEAMRRSVLPKADMEVLEPIMDVEAMTPGEYLGAVSADLARHRGIVQSTSREGETGIVGAEVPLAELFDYASRLRSLTQGNGTFTMSPYGDRVVPKQVQDSLLNDR